MVLALDYHTPKQKNLDDDDDDDMKLQDRARSKYHKRHTRATVTSNHKFFF
jgi:hypothetical protein